MPEPIVLYDIPGKSDYRKAWSPNPWKTRFSLQYKGLPFRTEWVEYPDIKDVALKLGAKPGTVVDGNELYTVPMIYDPNTKAVVVDSFEIALYLDDTYPDTPPLFPYNSRALHAAMWDQWLPVLLMPLMSSGIHKGWANLNERSQVYFRKTRESWFGKKLEDMATEEEWKKTEEGFGKVAEWLDKNGKGKNLLFLGDKISFADIQLASILICVKITCGKDSEEWKQILGWHGGRWKAVSERFAEYETDV